MEGKEEGGLANFWGFLKQTLLRLHTNCSSFRSFLCFTWTGAHMDGAVSVRLSVGSFTKYQWWENWVLCDDTWPEQRRAIIFSVKHFLTSLKISTRHRENIKNPFFPFCWIQKTWELRQPVVRQTSGSHSTEGAVTSGQYHHNTGGDTRESQQLIVSRVVTKWQHPARVTRQSRMMLSKFKRLRVSSSYLSTRWQCPVQVSLCYSEHFQGLPDQVQDSVWIQSRGLECWGGHRRPGRRGGGCPGDEVSLSLISIRAPHWPL